MELSEVVNLQYAAPVAGVVFCALLVLIFGFKSPVQPPSFDFEHEEKKSQKKQKKQKKSTSNGHVHTESNHDANKAPSHLPTSKQDQSANKQQTQQSKVKGKKAVANNTKTSNKTETIASKPEAKEDGDVGEWTTQLSRKDKKLRVNKKEDGAKGDAAEAVSIEVPSQGEKKKEETSNTTPKSAKSKKEKKPEKKDVSKQDVEVKPQVTEEVVEAKVVDETEFLKVSNKKTKPTAKQKETKKIAEPEPTGDKQVKENAVEHGGESPKTSQTPKKKNKKQQNHQNETADATLSSPSSPSGQTQVAKKGDADSEASHSNPQNNTKGANNTSESSTKTENVTSSNDDSKVNFDELGGEGTDWLEAKPQKKKKKARREN